MSSQHLPQTAITFPFWILFLISLSTPHAIAGRGASHFPNVPLINQDGETVHFYDDLIKDKVVVVNFIFTHCAESCPLETSRLRMVQDLLGDRMGNDIFFYSITIDPAKDTPDVLKNYTEKFGIGPGWSFLTGKESDITLLRKKFGLYLEEIQSADSQDHNLSVMLGNDKTGQWIKRSPFDHPKLLANIVGYRLFGGTVPRTHAKSYAQAPEAPRFSHGESLYRSRCASCHTIGQGDTIGPDLIDVTERRTPTWLSRWLLEPDKMLEEKDPIAMALFTQYSEIQMPNMHLTPEDVEALTQYMRQQSQAKNSQIN